jgi:hypothetical protein
MKIVECCKLLGWENENLDAQAGLDQYFRQTEEFVQWIYAKESRVQVANRTCGPQAPWKMVVQEWQEDETVNELFKASLGGIPSGSDKKKFELKISPRRARQGEKSGRIRKKKNPIPGHRNLGHGDQSDSETSESQYVSRKRKQQWSSDTQPQKQAHRVSNKPSSVSPQGTGVGRVDRIDTQRPGEGREPSLSYNRDPRNNSSQHSQGDSDAHHRSDALRPVDVGIPQQRSGRPLLGAR